MKRFVLFFIIIISSNLIAQSKLIDGFLNYKWGATQQEVRVGMSSVTNCNFVKEFADGLTTTLKYEGGFFAGYPIKQRFFSFYKNELYFVLLEYNMSNKEVSQNFMKIVMDISINYGDCKITDDKKAKTFHYEWETQLNDKSSGIVVLTARGNELEKKMELNLGYYKKDVFDMVNRIRERMLRKDY